MSEPGPCSPVPEELGPDKVEHLSEPFFSNPQEAVLDSGQLDYHALGGAGLERLCFELLIAEGKSPRFFSRSGLPDLGVDLIVSDRRHCTVYQCKNRSSFNENDLRTALKKFCEQWLEDRPNLPQPDRYVLCCPLSLRDLRANETWEELVQELAPGKELAVGIWHREILDTRLRKNPDIVADLFSERVAEQFCDLDDWNQGLFRPVRADSGERRSIERYLELRDANRIVRDESLSRQFGKILTRHGWLLVLGPSGCGKTITTLDLACELDDGAWRVFFVDLRSQTHEDNLVEGIRRRSARPTIIVLDDAHLDFDRLEPILKRLAPDLKNRPIRLAVTAQWQEPAAAELDEVVHLVEDCQESGQVLQLKPSLDQYRRIVIGAFPRERKSLSDDQLERLYESTAHDLVILDMAVDGADTLNELDELDEQAMFRYVLRRYFGGESIHAPELKRLAAVAQFDIEVPIAVLPDRWGERYPRALQRLTVQGGRPPTRGFIHSSAAELVLRALSWSDAEDWEIAAREAIVHFLLMSIATGRTEWARDLQRFLVSRLRLSSDRKLKIAVLSDTRLIEGLAKVRSSLPLLALTLAADICRGHEYPYSSWLENTLRERVLEPAQLMQGDVDVLGRCLHTLRLLDDQAIRRFERDISASTFAAALAAKGDFMSALKLLRHTTKEYSAELVELLSEEQVAQLVSRTIINGRSLGTLSLALLKLDDREDSAGRVGGKLKLLEERLESGHMLRLLLELGTIVDILNVLRCTSTDFSEHLLKELNERHVERIVSRTIEVGPSLGTIHLALQDLGEREDSAGTAGGQLEILEEQLKAGLMLRLLVEVGTIVDFLCVLQHTSVEYSDELLKSLNESRVAHLVSRTIDEGRSIGTLNFPLRELGTRKDSTGRAGAQLELLEAKLGVAHMAKLLTNQATLRELFGVLTYTSTEFSGALLESLRNEQMESLVARSTAERRPLTRASHTLLALSRRAFTPAAGMDQRQALERLVGSKRWWRLLTSNADLKNLAYLLEAMSDECRSDLLSSDASLSVESWQHLIRRSDFWALCRFSRDCYRYLPHETWTRFRKAAVSDALECLRASDWYAVNTGIRTLEEISDRKLQAQLTATAADFLNEFCPADLDFQNFTDAANGLICLWHQRPCLRSELGPRILETLPDRAEWPNDHRYWIGGRLLLTIARAQEVPQSVAESSIQAFCPLPVSAPVAEVDPHALFLFIWNLFALWLAKGQDLATRFEELQPRQVWDFYLSNLEHHIKLASSKNDKLNALRLAGVVAMLAPKMKPAAQNVVKKKIGGFNYLRRAAMKETFIPAFFALHGLNLLCPPRTNFSLTNCKRLLDKANEYDERGPAVEWLCSWIRNKPLKRQPVKSGTFSLGGNAILTELKHRQDQPQTDDD